jgi:signal transduction histidine kinase/HPt (histidine-containing phosphotransfer) domain-containing protein
VHGQLQKLEIHNMSGNKPTILVVDDTPTNLRLLQAIFEREHFSVILAESGEAGLSLAATHQPDIVLLDMRMPGMGGLETLSRFKTIAPQLPVIMITADGEVAEAVKAIKGGAEDFLIRPIQSDHLVLTVRRALERRELQIEVEHLRRRKRREPELIKARDAALEMARLKSEFLAKMSHEVRTPLNAIVGFTELLLLADLGSTVLKQLETIRSNGQLLLALVDDILDFSKLDAGMAVLNNTAFGLAALLDNTIEAFAPTASSKGLALVSRIDPQVPPGLRGDPQRLRQVLNNPISNALKYTPQGQVHVTITKVEESGKDVVIRVEILDTGIGIPAEIHKRLFQPFVQADSSTSRSYGGTGLGLAITARIVEQMRGKIGFESEPGKGSDFHFTARFEKVDFATIQTSGVSTHEQSPRSKRHTVQPLSQQQRDLRRRVAVLVVEDNKANRFLSPMQLAALGYHADAVEDGFKALELLSRQNYDIVLMDCEMPGMDGYDTTHEIRRREGSSKRTIIIAMTAHAFLAVRERCLAAGMDDYLSKPVNLELLATTLDGWARKIVSGEAFSQEHRPLEGVALVWNDLDHNYIDEVRSLSATAGTDVFHNLVNTFLSELPEQVAALKAAIGTGNLEALGKTAHALKGAASTVGARGFFKSCLSLQESAERLDRQAAREEAETLIAGTKVLADTLRMLAKTYQGNEPAFS